MTRRVAGDALHFRALADAPHAEAWRPLDHAVARWVLAHGGSPRLAEYAAWASYAEGQGDSALPMRGAGAGRHGMPVPDAAALTQLADEAMVTSPASAQADIATPFVLDGDYFHLRRNYLHEVAVAQHLRARRATTVASLRPLGEAELDHLFQGPASAELQPQRDAVQQALGRRLFVLTGGPGTGKTTTVLRMLLALGREHVARHARPPLIRLAAPTGKAAQRLGESLRLGAAALHAGGLAGEWQTHLDTALNAEAGTLHRLLGSRGRQGGFAHHAENPLTADIVVVDEASMVDLALLRALLDALPDEALLVLVGDADQLTSVGTGSVLLDLVSALEGDGGNDLVRLRHCFRADTALVAINEAIRRGDATALATASAVAGSAHVERQPLRHARDLARRLAAWGEELRQGLEDAGAFAVHGIDDHAASARVLAALRQRQLLCALREGEFGAEQVNAQLEARLRQGLPEDADADWYPGRAVMISRNDPASDLYNGDVGLCLRHGDGLLRVWFAAAAGAGSADLPRAFAPGNLPPHQGAFALTVHKSQGSEYARVAVLLPPDPGNAVLSRQLLYTAVTRARGQLSLWAEDDVLAATLAASVERSAALRRRLETP